MMLTTRRKLLIARMISASLIRLRRLVGAGPCVQVLRSGIRWNLDLREGIDLALFLGQYQRLPVRVAERLQSLRECSVIDIGANVGAFALPLAQSVGRNGRVVAFEATSFAFAKLQANIALNPILAGRVTGIQAVLGDGSASAPKSEIYSSWRMDGAKTTAEHPLHGGTPMTTEGALVASLDELAARDEEFAQVIQNLAMIKLDVDGHELPILRGARGLIARHRPMLLIEIAPYVQQENEGGLGALIDEITMQGYQLHDPGTGLPVSHDIVDIETLIPFGAGIDLLGLMTDR